MFINRTQYHSDEKKYHRPAEISQGHGRNCLHSEAGIKFLEMRKPGTLLACRVFCKVIASPSIESVGADV